MRKVAITTNSASISVEEAAKHDVTIIPFHIIMDGRDYLDPEIDMEKLYTRLSEKKRLPTTSAPTVEEFLQAFTELSQNAEAILHISMTKAFTTAYKLALQAKEEAKEKLPKTTIEVIDSCTVAGGLALICLEAARAARQGKSLSEIIELVNHMIPRTTELSARDTLFYLDKIGRIFEAKSWAKAESKTRFRAIVEIDASTGGVTKPIARAKTRTQIMQRMVDIAKERTVDKTVHAAILHTKVPDQAEQLKKMLLSQLQGEKTICEELYIGQGSAAVALANGKGLIDLSFSSVDERAMSQRR